MAGRLSREAKLELQRKVWDLAATKFMNERQIAQRLDLPVKRVREIIEEVSQDHQAHIQGNIDRFIATQLDRYEWIAAQAAEAYERSKQNKVTIIKRTDQGFDKDGNPKTPVVKQEERVQINTEGDPRHLDIIIRTMEAEAKLLRLDQRSEAQEQANQPQLSADERLRKLQAMFTRIQEVERPQIVDTQRVHADGEEVEASYDVSD